MTGECGSRAQLPRIEPGAACKRVENQVHRVFAVGPNKHYLFFFGLRETESEILTVHSMSAGSPALRDALVPLPSRPI
jgi:hypothetical protein